MARVHKVLERRELHQERGGQRSAKSSLEYSAENYLPGRNCLKLGKEMPKHVRGSSAHCSHRVENSTPSTSQTGRVYDLQDLGLVHRKVLTQ